MAQHVIDGREQGQGVTHARTRSHHRLLRRLESANRIDAVCPLQTVDTVSRARPARSLAGRRKAAPGTAHSARPLRVRRLVHVAPVVLLQEPGEEREQRQEQDHPYTKTLALEGGRLPRVLEEN